MLTRRRFLTLTGLSSLGLLAAACVTPTQPADQGVAKTAPTLPPIPAPTEVPPAAAKQATVRFATITAILDNAIWMVGKEQGFFNELGIDLEVQLLRDDSGVISAVLSGEADFADGGAGAPLSAREKGGPVKIIAASRPRVPFILFTQPSITSLNELKGKAIGVPSPGTLPYLMMLALLDKVGISKGQVTLVNIGATPLIYQALVGKKVDAGPAPVAFLPSAEKDGVKPLLEMWKELPDYMANAFYASERAIADRGDAIARAMAGLAKSYRYTFTPESKQPFIKKAVEQLQAQQAQAEFYWDFLQRNHEILAVNLEVTSRELEFSQRVNVKFGSQGKVLPFEQVTDLSLQKQALELVSRV